MITFLMKNITKIIHSINLVKYGLICYSSNGTVE